MSRKTFARAGLAALCLAVLCALSSCVDQHPVRDGGDERSGKRIVATSPAVASMCDRLDLDLVGVPATSRALPQRYGDAEVVGPPMGPDLEKLSMLRPDCIVAPGSLLNDLQPKFAQIGAPSMFVDLNSVEGLHRSMDYLGIAFGREAEALKARAEYEAFMTAYRQGIEGLVRPRVLVLMGVPGSYLVATPRSYAGSLVQQAGGENVYADAADAFVNVSVEDMLDRDPDVILRTSHALPDQVMEMFAQEFSSNDTWKHFRAVRAGRVYDLSHERFGMSATFAYPEALEELKPLLYGNGETV